jgi:hypothetical protein
MFIQSGGYVAAHHDMALLAAIICVYSFSEFLLKRFLWKPAQAASLPTLLMQSGITFILLLVGTLGFCSWSLAVGFVVVIGGRMLCEVFLFTQNQERSLEKFLIVQVISILLLAIAWRIALPINVHDWYGRLEVMVLESLGGVGGYLQTRSAIVLVILSAYFFMVDGGARIVRSTLNKFPVLMEQIARTTVVNNENRGEWIGVLERIITLTFVLTGNYTAVAFALTAKSIARFKELDDKNFAEYYLLGTSASVATALLAGSLVRFLM